MKENIGSWIKQNLIIVLGVVGSLLACCGVVLIFILPRLFENTPLFSSQDVRPPYYGVFIMQNGELVELQEQEIFSMPIERDMVSVQSFTETRPAIIVWRADLNLAYLEFNKLNQFLGETKNKIRYNATPKDDGIVEIVPASPLGDGIYCLIQGDPLAVTLPGWCFRIGNASSNLPDATETDKPVEITSPPIFETDASTPAKLEDKDLIAFYTLDNTGEDSLGKYPPMIIKNSPFTEGGIYCNGIYAYDDDGCVIETPVLSEFDYQNFTISVDFKVTAYPQYDSTPDLMPIFVGGTSGRWIGVFLRENGVVGLQYNNHVYSYCDGQYEFNKWHNVFVTYDGKTGRLYLDNKLICSREFVLEVHDDNADKIVTTNNYSYGLTYMGIIRNLKIYRIAAKP